MSEWVLTVAELNEYVRKTLAGDPMLRGVRLRGEISNFKRHISGHWYFTLKDEQSAINCAMFRQAASGVGFVPRDGQRVVLLGSASLYTKTGQYQFYVDGMRQDGVGDLFLRFEELKKKLAAEGLFDPARKKPLPLLPRVVGVVTSKTGAVVHDIQQVSRRRNPGVSLCLYPAQVQGEGAAAEIVRGLRALDEAENVDVIIVGRGGGSMEDLWPFNEEIVARAISECQTPVISAVGHETDYTIADFVADLRAPTPSAAAEIAVPEQSALVSAVEGLRARMTLACEGKLNACAARLAQAQKRLAEQAPDQRLTMLSSRAELAQKRLEAALTLALQQREHRVSELRARLRALGPTSVLARGFALALKDGKPLVSAHGAQAQDEIQVILHDGALDARVLKREEQTWLNG